MWSNYYYKDAVALDYYSDNPVRKATHDLLLKKDDAYKSSRKYSNKYRDDIIWPFENTETFFTLDLHGFQREAARTIIVEFLNITDANKIPMVEVICGNGDTLRPLLLSILKDKRVIFGGNGDTKDEDGDYEDYGSYLIKSKNPDNRTWIPIDKYVPPSYKWNCLGCSNPIPYNPKPDNTPGACTGALSQSCPRCGLVHQVAYRHVMKKSTIISFCDCYCQCTSYEYNINASEHICPQCMRKAVIKNGVVCNLIPLTDAEREKYIQPNKASKPNSDCFIATAVYGDPNAFELDVLRRFRDETLMNLTAGRIFCRIYYRYGKYAASIVREVPFLKSTIRNLLDQLIIRLKP